MSPVCHAGAVMSLTTVTHPSGAVSTQVVEADLEAVIAAAIDRSGLRSVAARMKITHQSLHERQARAVRFDGWEIAGLLAADSLARADLAARLLAGPGEAMEAITDMRGLLRTLGAEIASLAERLADGHVTATEARDTADSLSATVLPLIVRAISDCRANAQAVRRG